MTGGPTTVAVSPGLILTTGDEAAWTAVTEAVEPLLFESFGARAIPAMTARLAEEIQIILQFKDITMAPSARNYNFIDLFCQGIYNTLRQDTLGQKYVRFGTLGRVQENPNAFKS